MRLGDIEVRIAGAFVIGLLAVIDLAMMTSNIHSGYALGAGVCGFAGGWCLLNALILLVKS